MTFEPEQVACDQHVAHSAGKNIILLTGYRNTVHRI